jgi:alpha-galactosidase
MEQHSPGVSGIKLAYIGGGSRGWAWKLMADLALEPALSGEVRLYDIDALAAERNARIGQRISARADAPGKWAYRAVATLEEALEGADFVVLSILPGSFQDMASDVHAPERLGIYQSVGDTVGPGGILRALRTIPIYLEFGEAIRAACPSAWVINYTNPMAACVRALHRAFPGIKAFGCCHEVFGTREMLAAMLEPALGERGATRADISVNVLGINHFTWFDAASYRSQDLIPIYRLFVERRFHDGFEPEGEGHWKESSFASANRVKFDLFRRYGLIAAAGDRHLAEFLPPWYLRDPATVASWKFSLTSVDWRIKDRQRLDALQARLAEGVEEVPLKPSGEEGVLQMKALLGLGDLVTNVNLPNRGQCPDLPMGAIVETNALFARDSLRPVLAGALPPAVRALVMPHVVNQETVLEAAQARDKELAFKAFLSDPQVRIGRDEARGLFEEMLANTAASLGGGWR